jgi:tripartite-type tricarboxylate transporter receptor subunit TctC
MPDPIRRRLLLGAIAAAPALATAAAAQPAADAFPNRPVTFVLPVAPGGPGDVIARPMAAFLQAELGQPVVLDNRPGAGGTIGLDFAARSRPDGHTLIVVSNSTYAIAPHLYPMPYDNETAFAPVVLVAQAPSFVVVHRSVPASSLAELIALAKAKPDGLTFATAGIGFTSHLATELFMAMTGTRMLHVPYRGGAPASQAVLAGEVQLNFMEAALVRSLAPTGNIRPLAVTSKVRHPLFPDIPTIDEAGVAGFESATFWGVMAPSAVPKAILDRLGALVLRYLAAPSVREQITAAGFVPIGGDAASFAQHKSEDTAKWGRIIKERGIRIS